MNKDFINAFVRCAFKLCFTYLSKFLLLPFHFGSSVNLVDYDRDILEQIINMRKLLLTVSGVNNKEKTITTSNSQSACGDTELNFTKIGNNNDGNVINDTAYCEIKKNITNQLIDKYGDNICVDFSINDDGNKDKVIYSLKIKEIGRCDPDPKNFDESEIYVNTMSKQFMVKRKHGFESFRLSKKSILKCEKN